MTEALTLAQFRAISWHNTEFQVVSRSAAELRLAVEGVSLDGEEPRPREFVFVRPMREWAMLWDEASHQWLDHPDLVAPIGQRIEEAAAKQVGKLMLSFGGHHQLGWSRWGFIADSVHLSP